MGVKGLNKFFKKHASPSSIQTVLFRELTGKTVVVDTSIYLYKYLETGKLLENMYEFIILCLENKIIPIFIFDGKPPDSKMKTLNARYTKRYNACNNYYNIKQQYEEECDKLNEDEKQDLLKKLSIYKRRAIRLSNNNINRVKSLMSALCVEYYEAMNEADTLCAEYVKNGKAWACVSDDMDMFIYNCPRVLREWNIYKQEAILYNFHDLKNDLSLQEESHIKTIFALVRNDYCNLNISIETAMKWFYEYKTEMEERFNNTFVSWLYSKLYINENQCDKLQETIEIFNNSNNDTMEETVLNKQKKKNIDIETLHQILSPYGFIFI